MFDIWIDKLNTINDPCVETQPGTSQLFEIWCALPPRVGIPLTQLFRLFGSTRILSLWPRLSKSPVLRNFSWSPLVLDAFARNAHLFGANTPSFRFLPSYLRPSSPPRPTEMHDVAPVLPASRIDPIPGLLVLHIRRGDFSEHCTHLAAWGSDWNGFNKFATLPDKFRVPYSGSEEEKVQLYHAHCFPTITQIVARVKEVLRDQHKTYGHKRELKRVYIMTNGDEAWLGELKTALLEIKQWESVTNSRDLVLSWEAKPVAQAMDMMVGQRAQVFIGNGVCLTNTWLGGADHVCSFRV